MSKPLTTRSVEAMKPDPDKRLEVADGGLPGLYLVIQSGGSKSWAARFRVDGKPRKLTLGRYPALSLADARAKAREAFGVVDSGGDPAAAKQERRGADTVADLVEEYTARHVAKLSRRTGRRSRARSRRAGPACRTRPSRCTN